MFSFSIRVMKSHHYLLDSRLRGNDMKNPEYDGVYFPQSNLLCTQSISNPKVQRRQGLKGEEQS